MGQVVINLSSLTLDTMIFLHSLILCGIMAVVSPQTGYYQYGPVEGQCDYVAQDAITALCLAPFVYFYQKSMDANNMCGYYSCYNSMNCGPALTASPNSYMMEGRQGKEAREVREVKEVKARVKAMHHHKKTLVHLWKNFPTV